VTKQSLGNPGYSKNLLPGFAGLYFATPFMTFKPFRAGSVLPDPLYLFARVGNAKELKG
jgi:hypothetical protein